MVELLEATADLDAPVEVAAGPAGTTYQLAGRPFAWAHGLAFEAHHRAGHRHGRAAHAGCHDLAARTRLDPPGAGGHR